MLAAIRSRISRLWADLAHVGERQPLNKAALVVLVALDVFILVSIFDGLDEHTRQLASPSERVPHTCAEMVIRRGWNDTNHLDRLHEAVGGRAHGGAEARALHPVCAPLLEAVDAVAKDEELARALRARSGARQEVRDLGEALSALRPAYDTALLQTIAGQQRAPATAAIEKELGEKTAALETARAKIATIDSALAAAPPIVALRQRLGAVGEEERARLETDLRRLTFWFPVKRLGMQLLFLLPLLAVFYAWSARSARNGRGVQTLVSSHLLVVSFIPVFLKIVEALYEVIPKRLLAKVIALLVSLNLVAMWHYLVIAGAVGASLLLIFVLQRKLFSRERLLERRIGKGLCQECGKLLPAGARACPFCGFAQFVPCPSCGGAAHAHASHCAECGGGTKTPRAPDVSPGLG